MKKFAAGFLVLLILVSVFAPGAAAAYELPEGTEISAQAAYIVNLDTGIVVYEKNADEPRSIASLTKLMTCLLLMENVPDLAGTQIEADRSIYVPPVTGGGASHADILQGSSIDALSMLYAMLLPSANEAAASVAYYLGNKNLNNFYALMNARAEELGCKNTSFSCAHGLLDMEDGNYSTAHDVFLILQECWKHEIFRTVVSTASYDMPTGGPGGAPFGRHTQPYPVRTTNAMLRPTSDVYRSYIKGCKTGSTEDAGRCFASAAINQKGETYLGVTLGSTWDPDPVSGLARSFYDNAVIYDWLFANYSVRPSIDTTVPVAEVKVQFSTEADTVMLYPESDLKTVLPNNSDELLEKTFDLPDSIPAPVKKGDKVGTVTLSLNGEKVGTVGLVAGQDVSRNVFMFVSAHIKNFFSSLYFRVVCIVTAVFLVCYGALAVSMHRKEQKRKEQKRRARLSAQQGQPRGRDPRTAGRSAPPRRTSNGSPPIHGTGAKPPAARRSEDDLDLDFLDDDYTFGPPDSR